MTDANELITLACKVKNLGAQVELQWSKDLSQIETITIQLKAVQIAQMLRRGEL